MNNKRLIELLKYNREDNRADKYLKNLDSFDLTNLIVDIEDNFNIKFSLSELNKNLFSSIKSIKEVIQKHDK